MGFTCRNNKQPSQRLTWARCCGHRDGPEPWNLHGTTAMDDGGLTPLSAHLGSEYQSCEVSSEVRQLVPHAAELEASSLDSTGEVLPTLLRLLVHSPWNLSVIT